MKCKKCGCEDFEIRIVDIRNERTSCGLVNFLYGTSWIVGIISGFIFFSILFQNSVSTEDFWQIIAGVIVDSIELIVSWKVFAVCIVINIICTLYVKLLPYKVIPIKKIVCKGCGAEFDGNE